MKNIILTFAALLFILRANAGHDTQRAAAGNSPSPHREKFPSCAQHRFTQDHPENGISGDTEALGGEYSEVFIHSEKESMPESIPAHPQSENKKSDLDGFTHAGGILLIIGGVLLITIFGSFLSIFIFQISIFINLIGLVRTIKTWKSKSKKSRKKAVWFFVISVICFTALAILFSTILSPFGYLDLAW